MPTDVNNDDRDRGCNGANTNPNPQLRRLLSLDLGKFRSMHLGIFNQRNTD